MDNVLGQRLRSHGAVLIEGPKACGKASTARQLAASEVRLDADVAMRRAGLAEPPILLEGPTPRLIDEWQRV
ncbi:MAG: ATP-binding protein, partial [Actinobacteria bacterium]|nr:ATP-binding protein [Actinomycetota bacterium]